MSEEVVLFESTDGMVELPVLVDAKQSEVWLTRRQLSELFRRDVKTNGKHVNNALREELADPGGAVVAKFATTAANGNTYQTEHYSLDMILSVGYRVKSQRGVEFRRWATDVLRRYVMDGYAANVAATILIAESQPEEKDAMVGLVMNFLELGEVG